MPFIILALCFAAVPVAALAILAVAGLAAVWPAVVAITATLLAAGTFALIWSRDVDLLDRALRLLTAGDTAGPETGASGPLLMEPLGQEIARLSRHLATKAAAVEQASRADSLILERLPDALIVLHRDGSITRRNAPAETDIGDDLPAVLRHPDLRAAIDQALADGETKSAELSIAAPIARELRATVVPLNSPPRDGGHAFVVLSDRTREHNAERAHADFVANVSHELRTPLASLIGFTETLLGPAEDDPPARKRFLTIMAEQGARMNRLIDDLLSLSRIEMNEHQAPAETVDLTSLLPRIVAAYEPRLSDGQSRIVMEIARDTPPVAGDADQIAQVMQNLLDNAVKYGKEGGTVRLTSQPAEAGSRSGVVMSVADDGIGIPRADLPRVTERFYRVDKGRSRAAGGTGLGLAIVKHIVNRHRGQLSIDSEEGRGTTVSVWLPMAQPTGRAGG